MVHEKSNTNIVDSQDLGNYSAKSGGIEVNLNLRKERCMGDINEVETYKADFMFQSTRWQGDVNYPCVELHESVTNYSDVFKGVKDIADSVESFLAPMSCHYDLRDRNVLKCIFSLERQTMPS